MILLSEHYELEQIEKVKTSMAGLSVVRVAL